MTAPLVKKPQNSALLQVRISRDLRDEFMQMVKDEDDSASRLVRQWIRQYVKASSQEDLFNS
jgi:metal-responsive CopG/Arc/MetJ family transcriptional regulator